MCYDDTFAAITGDQNSTSINTTSLLFELQPVAIEEFLVFILFGNKFHSKCLSIQMMGVAQSAGWKQESALPE